MSLTIRQADLDDADRIVLFNQAMARETEGRILDRATLRDGVRAILEDDARGRYYVAETDEGEIVGQLAITTEWSDWRNGVVWWIQNVYVAKSHRRRGVYRQLHFHVRDMAVASRVRGLRLYVEHDNEAARVAYEALGMNRSPYDMFEEFWPE